MSRISLGGQAAKPVERTEIELWDRVFVTRPITKSVERQILDLEAKLEQAASSDDAVALFGELIDALTEPTGGQKKTASAVIVEKWEADKLEMAQIAAFVEQVQEAAAAGRPT